MTRNLKTHWLWVTGSVGLSLSVAAGPVLAQNQPEITAFVENGGRTVFTNFAISTIPIITPPPTAPTIGPEEAAVPPATTATPQGPFDDLIRTISARHGVDANLTRAVIEVESNFNRRAVSNMGAQGLMQLIPATADRFGVRDPFDPAQNIDGGVRYLRFLLDMFEGNFDLSMAGYNSGENRVARLGRIPNITETQNYVRKVRASYARFSGIPESVVSVAATRIGQVADAAAATVAPNNTGRQPEAVVAPTRISTSVQPSGNVPVITRSINERGVLSFTNFGANQ
jgi:hypothetical protein